MDIVILCVFFHFIKIATLRLIAAVGLVTNGLSCAAIIYVRFHFKIITINYQLICLDFRTAVLLILPFMGIAFSIAIISQFFSIMFLHDIFINQTLTEAQEQNLFDSFENGGIDLLCICCVRSRMASDSDSGRPIQNQEIQNGGLDSRSDVRSRMKKK